MYSEAIENALGANGIKIGDSIRLKTTNGDFEGTLMPRPEAGDAGILILKLKSGYNIGVKYAPSAHIEKLSSPTETFSFPEAKTTAKRSLEDVTMLYTGGTIGSKVDYVTGGVHMLTKASELLYDVPELADIANIEARDLMHIASEDISYVEWQQIAAATADAFKRGARGVIITMGTDMMHYTAAALSFMLKNLPGPVAITGAQRSSDRGSSDAFMNLICSAYVAAKSNIGEVGTCMHEKSSDDSCAFINGTKVRKMHTSRRDAFRPVNGSATARVSYNGKIEYLSAYRKADATTDKISAETKFEPRVALVKIYPNSDPGILDYYLNKGYKGIILEGTGLGHAPVSTPHKEYNWLEEIKRACNSGVVVGMTSQCLYGRVHPMVYRNLRLIHDAGAVYCEDMLPEVAYVKLGWLLGNHDRDYSMEWLGRNMAGEITPRTEFEWFDA